MKKVLMVAFHYPPYKGGSGVHRTLKFSRYLPEYGWQPIVLSANPKAYPSVGDEQVCEISKNIIVGRAFALNTARHLAIRGRYFRCMALPDQWVTWWIAAVKMGLKLVRRYQPQIIWSTYPIATAHLIGLTLHRLTRVPWVADFRDSMTEDCYPRDYWTRRSYVWIERRVVRLASRIVFTAPLSRDMYLERYPQLAGDCCLLLPNGYDEDDFVGISTPERVRPLNNRTMRLVHAGLMYTEERDPRAFFRAVSRLKKSGVVNSEKLVIDLRATGEENYYEQLLMDLGIGDIVRILPALPYRNAIQDCANADGLLLFQASSCNHQIPAKTYEYLRLGKPILGLTSKHGNTAQLLLEAKGATIIDLANEDAMFNEIPKFLDAIATGTHPLPDPDYVRRYSRRNQTSYLASIFAEMSVAK